MNYQQTIDYLYKTLPMFSRMGSAAIKKDLDNIIVLCEALGNPQHTFKTIHVGGTNGKGSVSHMLSSIFQSAGINTGLYTSPHLYDFRERIRVNGIMVNESFVVEFVEKIRPLIEKIRPSFFEITVAMAFEFFAVRQVEMAIIEVGLGGRLDSTNIISPKFSVITNIGWDHMNLLGNSLEAIATEKAGIIKPDIPVVIGERQHAIDKVFEKIAGEKQSPVYFASDEFTAVDQKWENGTLAIEVMDREKHKTIWWETDLQGIYQGKNICTVLKCRQLIEMNTSFPVSEAIVVHALKNVKKLTGLQGRWDVIHEEPLVVLEVAHNTDGIQQMMDHLNKLKFDQLHLIIGMVKDKDVDEVLKLLPEKANYYFSHAHIPRALSAPELKNKAQNHSLYGEAYEDVNKALYRAIKNASKNDIIIICGSIFLVAEVDKHLIGQLA